MLGTLRSTEARRNAGLLLFIVCVTPGCITPLDDDGVADTDPNEVYVGVYVGCDNPPPPGADESGDGGTPNFWYLQCAAPEEPETFTWCEDGPPPGKTCCFKGELGEPIGACFCKDYALPNSSQYGGGMSEYCIGPDYTAGGVNPLDDWEADEGGDGFYPELDDEIRAQCSADCMMAGDLIDADVMTKLCEDENWTAVRTRTGWTPGGVGLNCNPADELNLDDPDGSEIPWELVGGPTSPVPLDCALNGDCVDWFYPSITAFVLTPGSANFIEPETRRADYLAVESSGSNIELMVDAAGSGAGVDDTEPVFGLAEYTALDCVDDVCPFFLANLSAYNTTDDWNIRLDADVGRPIKKLVSDVQIDLLQSTLGVRHMGLNKVAFAPGALRLRVQVTVASVAPDSTYGDGTHATIVENDDYVFAEFDDGALRLEHTFTFQSGEGTLDLEVVPDEHPPVADHDLGTTEACDDPIDGLELNASHILSSDPDNDIEIDLWWVDGEPCGVGCMVPLGAHEVAIEARDARGAVDRSITQWVYVTSSC